MEELITQAIKEKLRCATITNISHLPHGLVHQFYVYETDIGSFFVKTANSHWQPYFEAEAKGLRTIDNMAALRVPIPYYHGGVDNLSFIILEYIHLSNHTSESQRLLGEQLAKMHQTKTPSIFGFDCDTALGSNIQTNKWTKSWIEFFRDYRLKYQFKLAFSQFQDNEIKQMGELLWEVFPSYFRDIVVTPSLLHGDLWYGNTGIDDNGLPVVYDPSCYYGHHEAEIGIMKAFGGFSKEFFDAYHSLTPKESGFDEREKCYQLYHYLNHYNMFGESYRGDCYEILKDLVGS